MTSREQGAIGVDALLAELIGVEEELQRLEEEKKRLRKELTAAMEKADLKAIEQGRVTAKLRPYTRDDYDEALLRERLGRRYALIVEPVAARVKLVVLADRERYAELLCETGKPTRREVQRAIESGLVDRTAFQGAFTKMTSASLAVIRQRAAGSG